MQNLGPQISFLARIPQGDQGDNLEGWWELDQVPNFFVIEHADPAGAQTQSRCRQYDVFKRDGGIHEIPPCGSARIPTSDDDDRRF